jgi:L-iditol 2-dehydrogenase
MRMKALVLKEYGLFRYEDVPLPEYGKDEVLIKVVACSICGSDVHGMDGSTGRRIPPIIMGHEAAGVIDQVGENVYSYQVGDRVTFDSTIYCGECYFCRRGEMNLCDNRKVLGVSCVHYRQQGAFAEYVAVPQHILYRMPDQITFEQAAMVEPLSVAFHAITNSRVSINKTAVVVGTGMIGLLVVQMLKAAGCGKIIAVDVKQEKLDLATKLGASYCLNSQAEDVVGEIMKITENRGADLAFEVVGIGATLQTAIASVKKGGSVTLVGNLRASVEFPLQAVVTRQISLFGSCASVGEYPDCLDLIASGKVNVDAFISAVVPLSEGASWFQRLYDNEPGLMKVILKP